MMTIYMQQSKRRKGINWRELGLAYRVFMPDPSAGILHILAAGRYSLWQRWVMARLSRQASAMPPA